MNYPLIVIVLLIVIVVQLDARLNLVVKEIKALRADLAKKSPPPSA
jgi:uncharacterized small protein (DUF1192 family)